jgi:hypothetical protein
MMGINLKKNLKHTLIKIQEKTRDYFYLFL